MSLPDYINQRCPLFLGSDAIHGGHFEVHFENVRVPKRNIILGKPLYHCLFLFTLVYSQ